MLEIRYDSSLDAFFFQESQQGFRFRMDGDKSLPAVHGRGCGMPYPVVVRSLSVKFREMLQTGFVFGESIVFVDMFREKMSAIFRDLGDGRGYAEIFQRIREIFMPDGKRLGHVAVCKQGSI